MLKKRLFEFMRSIRLRLVLSYLLVASLAVGIASSLGIWLLRTDTLDREAEDASLVADMALAQLEPMLSASEIVEEEIQAAVERISVLGDMRIRVIRETGGVIADSGHPTSLKTLHALADRMSQRGELRVIIRDEQGHQLATSGSEGKKVVMYFSSQTGLPLGRGSAENGMTESGIPIYLASAPARSVAIENRTVTGQDGSIMRIEVGEGPSLEGPLMDAATRAFEVAGWAAVFLALATGLLVSARISAPLIQLNEAVTRMQGGDLSVRAEVRGQDEIDNLAAQFNTMARRLEISFGELQAERDTLRRFVADAAHELRTPITALKLSAELLENAEGDEERAELISSVQGETNRLASMTQSLLDLSRLEAGIIQPCFDLCCAADLLQTACSEFLARAVEKSIDFQVNLPDPGIILHCDRPRLEMALINLLDNAIKYTPAGGCVCTRVDIEAGEVAFWIIDDGPGISAEDLPFIFSRFYRGKDRNIPGNGLGLAIVKNVAELHHGQAEVFCPLGGGVEAVIRLPLVL